jgi:uncharacterized protein
MKRTIQKIVPEEIILFGSMAEGRQDVHSDLDVLIVTDEPFQKHQIAERAGQFARDLTVRADILVYSQEDLLKAYEDPYSFLACIRTSGKSVYKGGKYLDF